MSSILARSAFENLRISIGSDTDSSSDGELLSPKSSMKKMKIALLL